MNQALERLHFLFDRYKNANCTDIEKAELMELLSKPTLEEHFKELIQLEIQAIDELKIPITKTLREEKADQLFSEIVKAPVSYTWWRYAAAAALIALFFGAYWYQSINDKSNLTRTPTIAAINPDIQPGGNKAVLTLADGSAIKLDSAANGNLATQGGTNIRKAANGLIVYSFNKGNDAEVLYNSLSTPRGGQYQLTLPDGSKVWLNAASTLSYPTSFTGPERRVEITGEAYFEVAKNATQPFIVRVNNAEEVRVLGTHFNINAYTDEGSIKTTLLEGSVLIRANNISRKLIPGQQSELQKNSSLQNISTVDTDEVTAWKNGYFQFMKADVQTVMPQFSRWYDVDVDYKGTIPTEIFGGKLERSLTLTQVLAVMEKMGLQYQLTNRKLLITNAVK